MRNSARRRRVRGEFADFGYGNRSVNASQPFDNSRDIWWAHQDSNLGPTDYESAALTAELWARIFLTILHDDALRSMFQLPWNRPKILSSNPGVSWTRDRA